MKFLSKEKISNRRYKTPEGYLVCLDAIIARTGSQDYTKAEIFKDSDDDSIVKLYRPEKEVFSPQTIASFENKPFVDEHPDEDVNVDNHREYAIGFVRDVRRATVDGEDVLIANLVVTDPEAISEIESGEKVELSCGYDCDILGEEPNLYQANIRGNHVALCKAGRAGIARIQDTKIKDSKWFIVYGEESGYMKEFKTLPEAKRFIKETQKFDKREGIEDKYYIEVEVHDSVKDSKYSKLLKDLSPEERLSKIDELIADEEEAIVGYKEAMKYANEADKSIYAHIIAEELEHITELKTLRAENFEKNGMDDAGTTRRMFRESEVGDEDSWFGTTDWGTPKGNMYIYKKNGKIIAEGSYDGWHNALQKGEKKEFNSVKELNRWLNTSMEDSIKNDIKKSKKEKDSMKDLKINYKGYYIEELTKLSDKTKRYQFGTSDGDVLTFKSLEEAKKYIDKNLTDSEEIVDDKNVEVEDKLIAVEESYINELKRDIEKMGFKVVSVKKYLGGEVHFQILSNKGDMDNSDLKYYAERLGRIDDKFGRYKIPMTFNIGLQYNGYISAGIDLRQQWIKDSIKDTHFTVSSNRNSEEFNSEEELLKKYKIEGYDTVRGIKAPKLKGLMGPFFNGDGKILYETKERYGSYDSCKDEAIYKWMADPEDEQDLINEAKKLGCQLQKVGSLIQVTGPISKIAKVLGETEESIIKASQQRMSTIKKVKDVDTYKEVTRELEKETKKLDSLKILKLINIAKKAKDSKIKDRDFIIEKVIKSAKDSKGQKFYIVLGKFSDKNEKSYLVTSENPNNKHFVGAGTVEKSLNEAEKTLQMYTKDSCKR